MLESDPTLNLRELVKSEQTIKDALVGTNEDAIGVPEQLLVAEVLAGGPHLAAFIIALRRSFVGGFYVAAADLRSLEGAVKTGNEMMARFNAVGLDIKLL